MANLYPPVYLVSKCPDCETETKFEIKTVGFNDPPSLIERAYNAVDEINKRLRAEVAHVRRNGAFLPEGWNIGISIDSHFVCSVEQAERLLGWKEI